MRCRTCDYLLWNLRSRLCPECGSGFRPSEFEFAPSSVQFCCPHCNQSYYGTGEKGRIVPRAFDCVTCEQRIDLDEMVLLPSVGLEEHQTRAERVPWLERRRLGVVKAWFSTVRGSMTHPTRMIRGAPGEGKSFQAWRFSINTIALSAIIGPGFFVLTTLLFVLFASVRTGGPAFWGVGLGISLVLVGTVVGALLSIAIWGGLTHVLLRIIGKPDGSLRRTFQALCYSSGPMALGAIPCLGLYTAGIGAVWWVVSAVLMVKESQKVDGLRAAIAVLAPPGLAILLVVLGYAALFIALVTGAVPIAINFPSTAIETQTVLDSLHDYHVANGALPGHAVELVDDPYLAAGELVSVFNRSSASRIRVGGASLAQLGFMRPEARAKVVRAAVKGLPAGTIAHRLGDFVFTYHGIDLDNADPGLWLVVSSLGPSAATQPTTVMPPFSFGYVAGTPRATASTTIAVGRADFSIREITVAAFANALKKQNALRARYSLSPLPDPSTVTHKKPAVVGKDPQ